MTLSEQVSCEACPPGHFSKKMEDDKGATYQCLPCGPGTSQASGASLGCNLCKAGEGLSRQLGWQYGSLRHVELSRQGRFARLELQLKSKCDVADNDCDEFSHCF